MGPKLRSGSMFSLLKMFSLVCLVVLVLISAFVSGLPDDWIFLRPIFGEGSQDFQKMILTSIFVSQLFTRPKKKSENKSLQEEGFSRFSQILVCNLLADLTIAKCLI